MKNLNFEKNDNKISLESLSVSQFESQTLQNDSQSQTLSALSLMNEKIKDVSTILFTSHIEATEDIKKKNHYELDN